MNNIYKLLLVIALPGFVLLSCIQKVQATHAMGSDLTYRCLGPGPTPGTFQYEITFSFYRDCDGIDVSISTGSIDIDNTCGFPSQTVTLSPTPLSPRQITPICPTVTSTCNGGTFTGIEEWVYQGIITLPGACSTWTFSHSESARNSAITTLTPFGSGNLYVFSTLNNMNGQCNNSPTFSNAPVPFACVGQRFCFNHGAFDVDGDSLVYQLMIPRTGPGIGDTVQYDSLHSATQPVISVPPMSFNTSNGDFCMNPTQTEVTVLAVLVNEYRNGVLIGQVERDIQVTVLACSNSLPTITGINGAPSFNTNVCAGNNLTFYIRSFDLDPGDTTNITWDQSIPGATFTTFGGRRDSAVFSWTPSSSDISTSPYCFTVTVSDNNCPYIGVQAYAFCITVRGVDPDAGPDQTITCGATTTLTGSATGGNGTFTYIWDPGSVAAQTLTNVGVGTYYLTVTSGGCTNRDTVNVLPGLGVPSASFGVTTNCSGMPVVFSDSSSVSGSSITSWTWDFGDGNSDNVQNPTHLYAANGTYTVTLTVATPGSCTSSFSQQITINTNIPTALFTSPGVCDGTSMSFTDQSLGAPFTSWSWDFGDPASGSNTSTSQNPTHTFSSAGSYSVTLIVENGDGCQDQIQQNVTVYSNPVISVADARMCENTQATLNGPSGYPSYSWSNGETTQSITVSPASTQNYTLTVTDINGCTANHTATVNVDAAPVPYAGIDDTICEGTNTTLSASGGNTYNWNPGNITGSNINVSPVSTTIYTVTVSSNAGCTAQDMVIVNVNPMPVADIADVDGICQGETVTVNASVGAANILWTPGNFNTPSITVSPAATTTYTLVVSDAIGCTGTDVVTVVVNEIPVAAIINPAPGCGNNSILFNDNSSINSGTITGWQWDFGNGQTSGNQNPTSVYSNPGNYDVTLIVTTDGGCSDTAVTTQVVWATPVAGFNHTTDCEGMPVSFTDASSIGDGSALNYFWTLGDNTTNTNSNFTHSFSTYGAYNATLHVTSSNGCIDSVTRVVDIYPYPDANFNLTYSCEDQPTQFMDASTIPQGSINSWFWRLDNNGTSFEQNPLLTYTDPGTYNVYLLVTSNYGCQDSTNKQLRIAPKPVIDFSSQDACLGDPVDFTDFSFPVTGTIVQYNWNFGDGSFSTDQNPQHTYTSAGWFDVVHSATTDSGCTASLVIPNSVNIYPLPAVNFASNASVADEIYPEVSFINQTSSAASFLWNFGDGDTSTAFSPTHLYEGVGHFDVQLIAMDMNGCIDSIMITIEIKPTSNIFIPSAFTPNGDLKNDLFQVYSYNMIDMQVQIFDRWGLKIAEWNGIKGGWDGRKDGDPVQSDTYVYRVSTLDVNAKREVYVGHVSVVR